MCIEKMIDGMSDACYTMDNNQHCEVRMKNKQPPFQITNKMIADVAEISELTGRLSAHDHLSSNPNLRRTNRIRTIHGSLAIEQNTLSLEQVTAHGIMTSGLVDESGIFRSRPVGVVDQDGPAFWHAAAVCACSGHGAVGLGKAQRPAHADPKLRVSL